MIVDFFFTFLPFYDQNQKIDKKQWSTKHFFKLKLIITLSCATGKTKTTSYSCCSQNFNILIFLHSFNLILFCFLDICEKLFFLFISILTFFFSIQCSFNKLILSLFSHKNMSKLLERFLTTCSIHVSVSPSDEH